ncbi:MAG: aldo/keto reductase [Paracoccaceae bacterium]
MFGESVAVTTANRPDRRIGQTALDLPVFGLGAAHLGELYSLVSEAQSQATLNAAWDAGIRYYDTAAWYGRGLSEHRLGAFLRTKPRSEFKVTTKVGRTLHRPKDPAHFDRTPWLGGLNFEVSFDYTYGGIMRSYEQALQRIALDTIDALVIHDLDASFHGDQQVGYERQLESGINALVELKKSGDIKAFGMGINTNDALEQVAPRFDLDFCLVAMPYTLLDHASLHHGMASLQKRGVSAIIGAPFASGILVTGSSGPKHYAYSQASSEIQSKARAIEAVCSAHHIALPAAALQFLLAHPIVASVIPGGVTPNEVTQNLASCSAPIPTAFWAELKAQGLIDPEAPVSA